MAGQVNLLESQGPRESLLPKTPFHSQKCQPSLNHTAWFRQSFFWAALEHSPSACDSSRCDPNTVWLTSLSEVPRVLSGLILAPGSGGAAMTTAVSVWTGTHHVSVLAVQTSQSAQAFRVQCTPRDSQHQQWRTRAFWDKGFLLEGSGKSHNWQLTLTWGHLADVHSCNLSFPPVISQSWVVRQLTPSGEAVLMPVWELPFALCRRVTEKWVWKGCQRPGLPALHLKAGASSYVTKQCFI